MKLNFFDDRSPLYDFRWFIVIVVLLSAFLAYHDAAGGRVFASSGQQQWSTSGPGYHK